MLVVEVIIVVAFVAFVVGGLFFVLALERSASRPRFRAMVWWRSLVAIGLLGVAIAWITSAVF